MLVVVYNNVVTSLTTLVTPDVASEALVGNTCKHKGGSLAHMILSCAMCTCLRQWNYTIKAEGNIGLVCSFFHTLLLLRTNVFPNGKRSLHIARGVANCQNGPGNRVHSG